MTLVEFVLFASLLALIFAVLAYFASLTNITSHTSDQQIHPYHDVFLNYLPWLIASVTATLIVHKFIFHRTLEFSGFGFENIPGQFVKGFIYSFLMLAFGFLILYLSGWIRIEEVEMNAYLFFGFLVFFLVQSSVEEVMLRSFLLPTIGHRMGIWPGIILSAFLFMFLHIGNPNITLLSLLNILMAGILLGIIFIRYGQIWAPIGLHAGWNFLQGSFFGFEVSGLDMYSYIGSIESGPDIITGGAFGFEGSLLAFTLLTLLSWWIWRQSPHKFKGLYLISAPQ